MPTASSREICHPLRLNRGECAEKDSFLFKEEYRENLEMISLIVLLTKHMINDSVVNIYNKWTCSGCEKN